MKVGDLARIEGTGIVGLVTRIESVPNFYKRLGPTTWITLHGHSVPLKASKLEVISNV